jgi:hypothetical protein
MIDQSMIYMLMGRAGHDSGFTGILTTMAIAIIAIPFLKIVIGTYITNFDNWFTGSTWSTRHKFALRFIGHEIYAGGRHHIHYSYPLLAICHLLLTERKITRASYINKENNGKAPYRDEDNENEELNYVLDAWQQFNYSKTIQVEFSKSKIQSEKQRDNGWEIALSIRSSASLDELNEFVDRAVDIYKQYMDAKTRNKIYHFIYKGKAAVEDEDEPWSSAVLSDLDDPGNTNYETFDTLFTPNKPSLIADLQRLKDLEYYKRTGLKRKKGYIFYGPPGCGKTSSVIAMANADRRHILEIPMSRVKTNGEIEEILNLTSIHGVEFTKEQIILLFDEIDVGAEALRKRKSEEVCDAAATATAAAVQMQIPLAAAATTGSAQHPSLKPTDAICLGTLLSRLDGVGSYNGIVIVATTNCIEQLSPAIYRHGRLNPVEFGYMKQSDMIKMIETFYGVQLTDDQIVKLPTQEHEITPASMRHYLEQNIDALPRLIEFLRVLPAVMKAQAAATVAAAAAHVASPHIAARKVSMGIFDYVKI